MSATDTQSGINIDITPPTATNIAPAPVGWYRTPITFTITGSDELGGSGIDTCPNVIYSGPDGTGLTVSGACTDRAGNTSAPITSGSFNYDATPPAITNPVRSPAANAYGWNNTNVTVTWTCADGTSGPPSWNVSQTVPSEGAGQSATGTCTDNAGNTSANTQANINIDKTKPTVSGSSMLSGTCTDQAGNASASVASSLFDYDTTRPIATGSIPPANSYGWYNADVTVTFSGSDALSGIDTCTDPVVVSTEGREQSAVGFCKDMAGNVSSVASVLHINIDKTPPVITFIRRDPPPDLSGWNYTPVTLMWFCSERLSGPLQSPVTVTVNTEGAGQSAEGVCEDRAGNKSADRQDDINIYLGDLPPAPPTPTETASPTAAPATATSAPAQASASPTTEAAGDPIPTTGNGTPPAGSPMTLYLLGGILSAGALGGGIYFLFRRFRR